MARTGRPKGYPKSGGRKAGTPNKYNSITAEVRSLAKEHGPAAIQRLVSIMRSKSSSENAVIAACKELLDRGYGKAPQEFQHSGGVTITHEQVLDQLRDKLRAHGIEPAGAEDEPNGNAAIVGADL